MEKKKKKKTEKMRWVDVRQALEKGTGIVGR